MRPADIRRMTADLPPPYKVPRCCAQAVRSALSVEMVRRAKWAVGLPEDYSLERQVLAWALAGNALPRQVETRYFHQPLHSDLACAALVCGAWEGKCQPVLVARFLRQAKAWRPGMLELVCELTEHGAWLNHVDFDRFVARAKVRLRAVELERELAELRRELVA